jgi:hypothetical protein
VFGAEWSGVQRQQLKADKLTSPCGAMLTYAAASLYPFAPEAVAARAAAAQPDSAPQLVAADLYDRVCVPLCCLCGPGRG